VRPEASGRALALAPALAVAVVVSAAYALGAAATSPFTVAADVLTAIPIAALAVAVVVRWPLHPRRDGGTRWPVAGQRGLVPWAVLAMAIVVWELVEYLAPGSRSAHPTLSSMADALDRHVVVKAVVFAAWLWLCVLVALAGSPTRALRAGERVDRGDRGDGGGGRDGDASS
jgi:hypothetical protein